MTAALKHTESSLARVVDDRQQVVIHGLDWDEYDRLCDIFDERPVRMTYFDGTLEIVMPSSRHERRKHLWNILICMLAVELDMRFGGMGSTTFRNQLLKQGLEPDECYYFENWPKVRKIKRYDPKRDPSPDLVLEVEETRRAIKRLELYQRMRVPEVWRDDGEKLHFHVLGKAGYREVKQSPRFPGMSAEELTEFVRQGEDTDETTMVKAFRKFVRERVTSEG